MRGLNVVNLLLVVLLALVGYWIGAQLHVLLGVIVGLLILMSGLQWHRI